jgi:hypothetical protein
VARGQRRPVLSLGNIRTQTQETACYFYNRLEKEAVRWVSYHFESKAERLEPDRAILSLIREVEENST